MNANEIEDLFIRSFDQPLNDMEKDELVKAMHANPGLAKDITAYKSIRESVLRKKPATFGPYFAHKVITRIQNLRIEIDKQIMFFFRKYQLAALGVLIALLAVNVIFADKLDLPSVLGIENTTQTVPAEDDLLSFDFYEKLTNN